jgi:hypothetical protein
MRLTTNLLPLKKSQAPRILSVLAGGNERQILAHDLGLERNYIIINVVNHTMTMHTLAFEHLAKSNLSVSFIHAYPGWMRTEILGNLFTPNIVWFNICVFQMDGSMGLESLWDFRRRVGRAAGFPCYEFEVSFENYDRGSCC